MLRNQVWAHCSNCIVVHFQSSVLASSPCGVSSISHLLAPAPFTMAFAPRGSKLKGPSRSPKQSPYPSASASSHTPASKAKVSLSFDRVQTPPGRACDDACSVRSSSGSDSRCTFRPSGTAWYITAPNTRSSAPSLTIQGTEIICRKGYDLATAARQTSDALSTAQSNCSGMHLIHEDISYSQNAGLVTPAPREGQRFGASLHLADSSPRVRNRCTSS